MTLETFERMVRKLRGSYEKRMPDQEIMSFWFAEAGSRIPDEAIDWIILWIKDRHKDKWPNHFQDALKTAWSQWLQANPSKRAYEPERTCNQPHCEDGLYWVRKKDDHLGYLAGYALPCVCGRRKIGSTPQWTWAQVKAAGYEPQPAPGWKYNPREHGSVDDAINQTTTAIGWE